MLTIPEYLSGNAYPGRGIILGKTADGKTAIAYFIMGRSENSRNRVFTETEDGIKTEAYDPSKMEDPSLIIYHPVRVFRGCTIVTNGDQTDTIRDGLALGGTFASSLHTREFEPDAPNYTPRISGIVFPCGGYQLSILKSADGDPSSCERFFYTYDVPRTGVGHCIHTYVGDGSPLPSFTGEPKAVKIDGSLDAFTQTVWDSLDRDNRISLYTCFIDHTAGTRECRIINKHQ